ncbi:MAG: ABC transporter ATP-binding protein [bacterium]|nr:ABC transporter ATP-binding protein [bacterium]
MPELLTAQDLSRNFVTPHRSVAVLSECNLSLAMGEALSILGASGSGKSTLLYILGTLDRPDTGQIFFKGRDLLNASARDISLFRQNELGFIFQFHHLLPEFSALENVAMPGLIAGLPKTDAFARAGLLLERVSLSDRVDHRPGELSGGEQQRVAVARALMNRPGLILADEPTGNLDESTGAAVADCLFDLIREEGVGMILVTHDRTFAGRADKSLTLTAGRLNTAASGYE